MWEHNNLFETGINIGCPYTSLKKFRYFLQRKVGMKCDSALNGSVASKTVSKEMIRKVDTGFFLITSITSSHDPVGFCMNFSSIQLVVAQFNLACAVRSLTPASGEVYCCLWPQYSYWWPQYCYMWPQYCYLWPQYCYWWYFEPMTVIKINIFNE